MAIIKDGKIVSGKDAKKIEAVAKNATTKNNIGKEVWWIRKGDFHLFEGKIIKETETTYIIDGKSRHYMDAGNSAEEYEMEKKDVTFNKT